jgi:hypothetical protein
LKALPSSQFQKRIKEELEKWPDMVSNEIEIIEIDTDCKSMK